MERNHAVRHIVLLCECQFTRLGLRASLHRDTQVFSAVSVEQGLTYLTHRPKGEIDLVVLSARSCSIGTLARLLTLIGRHHPSSRVLLDPGAASLPLLRFYLNCLTAPVGLIDFTRPVPVLLDFIQSVLCGSRVLGRKITDGESLNARERTVLLAVMRASSGSDIGRTLSLSVKTVSHYKCTGLRKLGARNLQELLLPSTRRYPRKRRGGWASDMAGMPVGQSLPAEVE